MPPAGSTTRTATTTSRPSGGSRSVTGGSAVASLARPILPLTSAYASSSMVWTRSPRCGRTAYASGHTRTCSARRSSTSPRCWLVRTRCWCGSRHHSRVSRCRPASPRRSGGWRACSARSRRATAAREVRGSSPRASRCPRFVARPPSPGAGTSVPASRPSASGGPSSCGARRSPSSPGTISVRTRSTPTAALTSPSVWRSTTSDPPHLRRARS